MIKSLGINIVTHNGIGESFLKQAIAAVSPYSDEIIVYDDASTDNTYWILKKQFLGVVIEKGKERLGPKRKTEMLNKLKLMTKSEWILRIDDDEIFPKETMEEIVNIDGSVPSYSIPFLHYEDGHFIDPKCHKKSAFYVARLFKNIPEISWVRVGEVIAYNGRPISSRANQVNLCKKITNPFLHLGELRSGEMNHGYGFHAPGHCAKPLGNYEQYIPEKN